MLKVDDPRGLFQPQRFCDSLIFPGKEMVNYDPDCFLHIVSCAISQTIVQYSKIGVAKELTGRCCFN